MPRLITLHQFGRIIQLEYLLILACAILAIHPIFQNGFLQGHDLILEFVRVSEYAHSIKAGIFPVRWGSDLEGGHGYPIYNFFPPLFSLVASVFILAGNLAVSTSIKLAVFLFTLTGGVGMYVFAREYFEKNGAVLAACLYILAPYHFIDVFVRNAFSEFAALSIVPFVFYSLARILKAHHPNLASLTILAISSALFILSHNLSIIMYAPLLSCYFLVGVASSRSWGKLLLLIIPLLVTFLLTSFYVIPLLLEKQFVQIWMLTSRRFNVLLNFISLEQLMAYWLTPFSGALMLLSLGLIGYGRKKFPVTDWVTFWFFIFALVALVFLITPESKAVWESIEFLGFFQFPWRFLSPASFIICFLPGVLVYLPNERIKKILGYGLILLGMLTIMVLSVVMPKEYSEISDESLSRESIKRQWLRTTVLSEYLPIWVKIPPRFPVEKRLVSSQSETLIYEIEESPSRYLYKIGTTRDTLLTANLFYFPGWKVYVNGGEIKPSVSEQGLMQFYLPKGLFLVDLKFENTPARTVGNSLSILGLLLLGILIFLTIRATRRQQCLENQGGGK